MRVDTEIAPYQIASEMSSDGGFAMDTLAHLAEYGDTAIRRMVEESDRSQWHDAVAPFLRKLAAALETSQ